MKRIIISVVLLAVILLGGSGCMQNNPVDNNPTQNNQQNINDAALAYMEQKYSEKFEYVAPWGNSMSGTHELIASCASLPGQEIFVQIENYKQDDKVFRDNFLAVKYSQQVIDFICDCVDMEYGVTNVFYLASAKGLSSELPSNASFEEYLADPRAQLSFTIEAKASSFVSENQAQGVADLIAASGMKFLLRIVFVNDDEYGTFTMSSLGDQIVLNKYVYCVRITNLDGDIQIEWLRKE